MKRKLMDIRELAEDIHKIAIDKGWYDENQTEDAYIERMCNNLHDEVSELHEAWRKGFLRKECDKADSMRFVGLQPLTCLEEELADIIIRVLDNSVYLNIDIKSAIGTKHVFNATRSYRHGDKKS